MSKTHRALAIVAVIVTLVTLCGRALEAPVGSGGVWFSYAPLTSGGGLLAGLITPLTLATTTIAAPIVSTFGAVVAGQEHRRGWLVAFILLGLIGVFGTSTYYMLELYLGLALRLRTIGIATDIYAPMILQALPAIAALIFVATSRRGGRIAGVARSA